MLRDNVSTNGSINNDKVACAVLQYHNPPLPDFAMSPAQLLFGRPLADFLPANPEAYNLHPHWAEQLKMRTAAVELARQKTQERYNSTAHHLKPLKLGQRVVVQNKTKRHFNKWNRTGTIVATLPYRQYHIKLDDTGNITLRNRRFIKPTTLRSNPTGGPFCGPHTGPCYPDNKGDRNPVPIQGSSPNHIALEQSGDTRTREPLIPGSSPNDITLEHPGLQGPHAHQGDVIPTREPLILRRLRPYNAPGRKEIL